MSRTNTEIKFIQDKTNYGPMPYGQFAGEPTVSIKLSSSENSSMKINSLENMWVSRNWKRKLSSGYARLRIYGKEPFADHHTESIEYLIDKINPRFLDIEVEDKFINTTPSTYIQRKTDTYTFMFDTTKDGTRYDEETMKYITDNIANYGNSQYIFKVDSVMCEEPVKQFGREYQVYDSDIWLFPKGRKRKTMEDNLQSVTNVVKRKSWNLSPRMDIFTEDEEESE